MQYILWQKEENESRDVHEWPLEFFLNIQFVMFLDTFFQMEAGQMKLRSRLEEERAKAALVCRIQRLTKLILVLTRTNATSQETKLSCHRRRHSFGDEKVRPQPFSKWKKRKILTFCSCNVIISRVFIMTVCFHVGEKTSICIRFQRWFGFDWTCFGVSIWREGRKYQRWEKK